MDIVFISAIAKDHLGNDKHTSLIEKVRLRTKRDRISVRPPSGNPSVSGWFPKKQDGQEEETHNTRPITVSQYSQHDASVLRKKEERRIRNADGVVAEITIENMELGIQLEMAMRFGKPILALLRQSSISLARQTTSLLVGAPNTTLRWFKDEQDPIIDRHLDAFIEMLKLKSASG